MAPILENAESENGPRQGEISVGEDESIQEMEGTSQEECQ